MAEAEMDRRLESLSPEKRRLLELRLAKTRAARGEEAADTPEVSAEDAALAAAPPAPMRFSLFFFSADGSSNEGGKYDALLDAVRFADTAGFDAVWTPERHFQDFGGLYPNPSVLAAALAMVTERVQLRAGSVVLPLHHPVRVAEEWAVVDNLSGGRAAISCATGWHPTDFILHPANFDDRRARMYEHLETLRRLWRGEAVELANGKGELEAVRSLPRPLQGELPIWVTSSGRTETWAEAGRADAHVLASLGSQPLPDLARKIEVYRAARREAGHGEGGIVSLMLHTFLADTLERAKQATREPLSDYLRTHLAQRDSFLDLPAIRDEDKEALIPLAFEHYVSKASLIGTVESCKIMIGRLAEIGVDEVACLIDFGLPRDLTQKGFSALGELVARHRPAGQEETSVTRETGKEAQR